jgi:hypothetical protein
MDHNGGAIVQASYAIGTGPLQFRKSVEKNIDAHSLIILWWKESTV